MTAVILVSAAALLALGVVAVQLPLYGLRWYEISNRVYDPDVSWLAALKTGRFRPVRVFAKEVVYVLWYLALYLFGMAGRVIRGRPAEFEPGEMVKGKPLIVLIHGLLGGPYHFGPMRRRFRRKSVPNVLTFEYRSVKGTVEEHVDKLRDFLLRIRAKTGMSEVALVGHSLGGVVAFEYARAYGETGEIKAVVTLGAPLRGSRLAVLGMSRAARSLHPTNPLFAEIASATLNTRFLSIYSRFDQLVLPYTNSECPAAGENREIDLCGHTGLFFNRTVFKIIHSWLLATTTPLTK